MMADVYRYTFADNLSMVDVEETLVLAIIATQSLHGESQARLDIGHTFDAERRSCVIDARTEVGRDFNRLFVGFITREFGSASFKVERVGAQHPEPAAV
jgi:hypothetical protein